MLIKCYHILILLGVILEAILAYNYDNLYGESYSEDWLLFYDEVSNQIHYINMTEKPDEPGERFFGSSVSYHLYTRSNKNESEELFTEDNEVRSKYLNPANNLKVITHGWLSSGESPRFLAMKDAYLHKYDVNVIILDWSDIAKNIIYPWAAIRTKHVGMELTKLLKELVTKYGMSYSQMHLIGHSLGAHVMGYAGSQSGGGISRITGLDPARPMFEIPNMGDAIKLDRSDAQMVDVIHTCGGILGVKHPIGHLDFYPNSGFPVQPGCNGFQLILEACSHGRATEYFTESIWNPEGFAAYECDSWNNYKEGDCNKSTFAIMGDRLKSQNEGVYYLETNSEPEFSRGFL